MAIYLGHNATLMPLGSPDPDSIVLANNTIQSSQGDPQPQPVLANQCHVLWCGTAWLIARLDALLARMFLFRRFIHCH